jgi:hypothetical protein
VPPPARREVQEARQVGLHVVWGQAPHQVQRRLHSARRLSTYGWLWRWRTRAWTPWLRAAQSGRGEERRAWVDPRSGLGSPPSDKRSTCNFEDAPSCDQRPLGPALRYPAQSAECYYTCCISTGRVAQRVPLPEHTEETRTHRALSSDPRVPALGQWSSGYAQPNPNPRLSARACPMRGVSHSRVCIRRAVYLIHDLTAVPCSAQLELFCSCETTASSLEGADEARVLPHFKHRGGGAGADTSGSSR